MVDESAQGERIPDLTAAVMIEFDPEQRVAFQWLWEKIPQHLQAVSFDFEKELWTPENFNGLRDLLCNIYQHATDLGHVTIDPFRIILKQDSAGEAATVAHLKTGSIEC